MKSQERDHSMIVTFPKEWIDEIDAEADKERRSRRNMTANLIREALDARKP